MSDPEKRRVGGWEIALGLAVGVALALTLRWTDRSPPPEPAAPAPTPSAPIERKPLVVVGIDGLSWNVLAPMIEAGELAALKGLAQHGLRGEMLVLPPLSSPAVWTTYATGRYARDHGVLDHTYPYTKGGARRRIQQTERQVPAIWDLASRAGLRSIVLGYYATHPAEQIHGFMVSDLTVTGGTGGVHPVEQTDALLALWTQVLKDRPGLIQSYLPWPYAPAAQELPDDPYALATRIVRKRVVNRITIDELMGRAALGAAREPFDLMMLYLRMPDHASHAAWRYHDPESFEDAADPLTSELLAGIVRDAYRQADRLLGALMAELDDDVNLLVLSDHGFGPATGRWNSNRRGGDDFISGQHRPAGVLLGLGPDLARGEVPPLLFTDVAPTLTALLGLPLLEEMPGDVATAMLSEARRDEARPPREPSPPFEPVFVDSTPAEESVEREECQALEALGYVEDCSAPAPALGVAPYDFWKASLRLEQNALAGEGMDLLIRGRTQAFDELVRLAEERNPKAAYRLERRVGGQFGLWEKALGRRLLPDAIRRDYRARLWPRPEERDTSPPPE